ncbi:cupin domain-containing protein [Alteromonas sp. CYL-A6]|uniref:cupin domain-containing protein n=1 Tax=Alteromonas nitratireducens TaxID=3390813 RepID=UPI0034B4A6AE
MNQDYTKAVAYRLNDVEWEASPAAGVWRKKLDREHAESGRATSVVRYDPGSSFNTHVHDKGEEILVLDGVFSDESGDYSGGWYFRNPPGSSHAPSSEGGCLLFVKLCHFQSGDNAHVATAIGDGDWVQEGDAMCRTLHQFDNEQTRICKLPPHTSLSVPVTQGREVLVADGAVTWQNAHYPSLSWLRLPSEDSSVITSGENGALLLVKTGHFSHLENA